MHILITILIIVASIIVILLIVGLFAEKEYSIQRETIINKPKEAVFNYIKLLKNQDNYNKWWMTDPNVKKDYRGTDGTVGFIAAWDSNNKQVGKGEQEIKSLSGQNLHCEVRFEKPFEGVSQTIMYTDTVTDNKTNVKWVFNGKNKYPMNVMFLFMSLDKMLGKDLATSLEKLKATLEK